MQNNIQIKDPVILKKDAVSAAGNAAKLARILGLSRAAVSDWGEYVPSYQAYRLVQIFPDLKKEAA